MADPLLTGADGPVPEAGRNCWRIENARRMAVVVDAADYFATIKDALRNADRQVLLIGWDFDTRITLDSRPRRESESLGHFILALARERPGLEIRILKWNLGALKILGRGSMLLTTLRWIRQRRISLRLDSAHPVGASHHQKLVVIDDRFAFCGGIDMTTERWDTREHRDADPGRTRPDGSPYGPWHDITVAVDGEAARALGELARDRWKAATGRTLAPPRTGGDPWPQRLVPDFRDVEVAIARTRGEYGDAPGVRESEALFVDLIASARRFIYAENQYFASRVIAQAIARRMEEPDPPEIVLVMPETAEGWLEQLAMDTARSQMMALVARADHRGRFRVYHPVTAAGEPIYVHAKLTIVDDQVLRVGSSNMNNRSMGLDSECDLALDARLCGGEVVAGRIRDLRLGLLAEHLGCALDDVVAAGGDRSLIECVERLRGEGRSLRPVTPDAHGPVASALAEEEILDPGADAAPAYEQIARPRFWRTRTRRPAHLRSGD